MIEPSPLVSHCDHCGLPLPVRSVVNHDSSDAKQYCCIGCRIAASLVPSDDDSAAVTWTLTRLGLGVFFAMNVMVFTLVLWTQDVYDSVDEQATASTLLDLFRYLSLLFTIPVLGLLGQPLLEESLAALRARRVTTDVLLTIGVAASFVYSLYSVLTGEGHVYFEVTCMVLVAVTLGRWFEATGKVQTTRAL